MGVSGLLRTGNPQGGPRHDVYPTAREELPVEWPVFPNRSCRDLESLGKGSLPRLLGPIRDR